MAPLKLHMWKTNLLTEEINIILEYVNVSEIYFIINTKTILNLFYMSNKQGTF